MFIRIFLLTLLFASHCLGAVEFRSTNRRVHLIELFSSEGCSSCPPADEWMASLRQDGGLWREFVPISFHVDYWNRLGWHDPFSRALFTARQSNYAAEWGVSNVYTPGFVLNGTEWKTGLLSSRRRPKPDEVLSGELVAHQVRPRVFEVSFTPQGPLDDWVANVALLGNGLVSNVTKGENQGRTLKHEFVTLLLESSVMRKQGKIFLCTLDLTAKLRTEPSSLSVAAWVSTKDSQKPVQAVGGDLAKVESIGK